MITFRMDKFLFPFLFLLVMVGCHSGPSSEATAIQTLSSDWNGLTRELTELAAAVSQEARSWQGMYDGMATDAAVLDQLPAEVQTEMNTLKDDCAGHGATYRQLLLEISGFFDTWEANGAKVDQLVDNKTKGKIAKDDQAMLEELQAFTTETSNRISDWQALLDRTKNACTATCARYAELAGGAE
jgi:hypothetical protein